MLAIRVFLKLEGNFMLTKQLQSVHQSGHQMTYCIEPVVVNSATPYPLGWSLFLQCNHKHTPTTGDLRVLQL